MTFWESVGAFCEEMFKVNLYKRSQGKIVRQATAFAAFAILFGLVWMTAEGLKSYDWKFLAAYLPASGPVVLNSLIPLFMAAIFAWFCYRLVQIPTFADFLIHVEAEMRKVSWPSRQELIMSSGVVIVVMFLLAGILFGYDLLLKYLLEWIGWAGKKIFVWLGIFNG